MEISNYKSVHFMVSPITAVRLRKLAVKKGTTMTDVLVTAFNDYYVKEMLKDEINQKTK